MSRGWLHLARGVGRWIRDSWLLGTFRDPGEHDPIGRLREIRKSTVRHWGYGGGGADEDLPELYTGQMSL